MSGFSMVRRLRQTSLRSRIQRAHRSIAPSVCTVIHALVKRLMILGLVPTDLALKHTFDYQVVFLNPALIERSLLTGTWKVPEPTQRDVLITRLMRWLSLGGGWKSLSRHASRNLHGRFIASGDWDLDYKPFVVRKTVVDLFATGLTPEQTAEYQKLRDRVVAREFKWTRGCRSIEDVDAYFAELIELYEAIRKDGYRTQAELGNGGFDEIRVCIDREGRPCVFGGGTHRLSIARFLGLERVPVVVKRVHPSWVQHCRTIHQTKDVCEAIAMELAAMQEQPPRVTCPPRWGSESSDCGADAEPTWSADPRSQVDKPPR